MKIKKLKIYSDKTGDLVPISLKVNIPFKTKRIFIIHGKKNYIRADHAHHKCSQFLIPLCGTIIVNYENKKSKFKKILSVKKNNCLMLKPKTWCKIKFNSSNSKLMVFCDKEYDPSDYIRNYKKFLTMITK
jgi:UDP-2-acetamido-3-amino-2,3-dideoxy-glucuronate N-acetyltransferase